MEAGRGQYLVTEPEGTCCVFPGDALLRAWLPGQKQGNLGRHCRHLRLDPCCLREGGARLVSGEGGPGCERGGEEGGEAYRSPTSYSETLGATSCPVTLGSLGPQLDTIRTAGVPRPEGGSA